MTAADPVIELKLRWVGARYERLFVSVNHSHFAPIARWAQIMEQACAVVKEIGAAGGATS